MDFAGNKLNDFTHKIIDLRDQPNMQPDDLKAYFDSSPDEVRQAHNGLCDALTTGTTAATAAANIGFQRTAAVPADTVQAAVENVQSQLDAAVMGNIPSGSVDSDKLAQDVRDRFVTIESKAASEASTRASADTNLQNQINTHTSQIASLSANKCEIYTGTYIGNGVYPNETTQDIVLGFRPKAVLVMYAGFLIEQSFGTGRKNSFGGIAIDGWSNTGISLTDNGFRVRECHEINSETGMHSTQVNYIGYTYVYLAFK